MSQQKPRRTVDRRYTLPVEVVTWIGEEAQRTGQSQSAVVERALVDQMSRTEVKTEDK